MLRLRAWQLFFVAMAAPLLIGIAIAVLFTPFPNLGVHALGRHTIQLNRYYFLFAYFALGIALGLHFVIQLIWQFKVGTELARKLPAYRDAPLSKFRFSVFLQPCLLIVAICSTLSWLTPSTIYYPISVVAKDPPPVITFAVLSVIWIGCLAFRYLHLTKVLRRIPDSFRPEVIFLFLYFWPLGLWVLQPRVKAFYEDNNGHETIDHIVE